MSEEEITEDRRIVELGIQIKQLPGFALQLSSEELDITRYIFDRNFTELQKVVTFVASDPRGAKLHTVAYRDTLRAFGFEIIRGIYNYTAAAVSLVQHTMELYNRLYGKNNLFPEYHKQARSHFPLPLVTFIHDLRHYCQHIKSPIITFETTWSNSQPTSRICIPVSDLQTYLDWKKEAKKFIASFQETVDIMEVLADFHSKEIAFQSWFISRQEEIHAREFKELDDKKAELRELMGDSYTHFVDVRQGS